MDLTVLLVPAYLTLLIGFVGWLVKGRLDRIEHGMDEIKDAEAACRLGNAERYATWDAHNKVAETVARHGERISRLEPTAARFSRGQCAAEPEAQKA